MNFDGVVDGPGIVVETAEREVRDFTFNVLSSNLSIPCKLVPFQEEDNVATAEGGAAKKSKVRLNLVSKLWSLKCVRMSFPVFYKLSLLIQANPFMALVANVRTDPNDVMDNLTSKLQTFGWGSFTFQDPERQLRSKEDKVRSLIEIFVSKSCEKCQQKFLSNS